MNWRVFLATMAFWGVLGNAWAYDFAGAAKRYNVPVELLQAISKVESGGNSLAVNRNRNGSVDLGHMQINSQWQKSGKIDWAKLTDKEYCSNVGAWVLAQELSRYNGNVWAAVAAYNTGKSAKDWEKVAEVSEGDKKARALILAATGREYSRRVYAALLKIQAGKGKREEPEKAVHDKNKETDTRLAAMAVMNPFGTQY